MGDDEALLTQRSPCPAVEAPACADPRELEGMVTWIGEHVPGVRRLGDARHVDADEIVSSLWEVQSDHDCVVLSRIC